MRERLSRREIIQMSAGLGLVATTLPSSALMALGAGTGKSVQVSSSSSAVPDLHPPASGNIPMAFVISDGAVMIDFAGPWEVFQDVMNPQTNKSAFHLYTVGETTAPVRASGGMKIVPDFSVSNAPAPKVIVIPAQQGESAAVLNWIRQSTKHTDLTMSVCTGAFVLANTMAERPRRTTRHTRPSQRSTRMFACNAGFGGWKMEILRAPAAFLPGSISLCELWSGISVATSHSRQPMTWNIKDRAG